MWPKTNSDDWCGEWKGRGSAPKDLSGTACSDCRYWAYWVDDTCRRHAPRPRGHKPVLVLKVPGLGAMTDAQREAIAEWAKELTETCGLDVVVAPGDTEVIDATE